jgi:deoxyribodipyrimidine photo-lyase
MPSVEEERVRLLKSGSRAGDYVLYWMQSSQRLEFNHALIYGMEKARKVHLPLIIAFALTEYPEAGRSHYKFMIEGLRHLKNQFEELGIPFIVRNMHPSNLCIELSKDASLAVVDRGYTKEPTLWYKYANEGVRCPLIQVESNIVVPVEEASPKEEYNASTLRRKLNEKVPEYLRPITALPTIKRSSLELETLDLDSHKIFDNLKIDRSVKTSAFKGGREEAERLLTSFIDNRLENYGEKGNNPSLDMISNMSPYLHFGQISPIEIALRVQKTGSRGSKPYLEELITRRELAINFVHYNIYYDDFRCLPEWCRNTLKLHEKDPREFIYTLKELEEAETHDRYWNSAQKEMVMNGKMHGYMRMYWGKKLIEWTKTPEEAYRIALYLNNKYELDGRDPNGYAGVAWCFGKHDRPWKERKIFGKVRYMNDKGLERKFNMYSYIQKINTKGSNGHHPVSHS